MKFAVIALFAAIAVSAEDEEEDSGAAAAVGDACKMGEDDCGYEKDQKLICVELDYSSASMTDEQKDALKDAGATDEDITKAEEKIQETTMDPLCIESKDCEDDSARRKEADESGVGVTCSAKALAATMVTALGALAAM